MMFRWEEEFRWKDMFRWEKDVPLERYVSLGRRCFAGGLMFRWKDVQTIEDDE
jgi:hypothetical protein